MTEQDIFWIHWEVRNYCEELEFYKVLILSLWTSLHSGIAS